MPGSRLADLAQSAEELDARLSRLESGTAVDAVEGRGGFVIASEDLAFMRLREVVYHHVDLAAGYSFEDVDGDLLARFISGRRAAAVDVEARARPPAEHGGG